MSDPLDGRFQYGYDARNSHYAAGLTGPSEEPSFQRLYTDVSEPPLTADGVLYTTMAAVEFDGDRRWDASTPVEGDKWSSLYPALSDDSVFGAGREEPLFWALSREDGTVQRRVELSRPARSAPRAAWLTVLDDRAFFATSAGVGCVDLATREETWQAELVEQYPFEPNHGWLAPAATTEHVYALNEDVVTHDEAQLLYALNPDSGAVDWTVELGLEDDGFGIKGPVVGDRYVFVIAHVNENPGAEEAEEDEGPWVHVVAVDPAEAEVAWTKTLEGRYGPSARPAAANGMFYVVHGQRESEDPAFLTAIDTADESINWKTETESVEVLPTVTDEIVYATDSSYCRAFDRDSGDPLWRIDMQDVWEEADVESAFGGQTHPPVVQDGRVFVGLTADKAAGLW